MSARQGAMVPTPREYWRSHELTTVTSFGSLTKRLGSILNLTDARSREWVFRGAKNEGWGLHSKLARGVFQRTDNWPTERELRAAEIEVMEDSRNWKLDGHKSGPLAGLELLAGLQHTGSPTRLIDVTHHALVAAWYACEESDSDGRVFALEVSQRELDRKNAQQQDVFWEHGNPSGWQSTFWVWTPAPFEDRMARQHGAFLVGGVPEVPPSRWYLRGESRSPRMSDSEVRSLTSIAATANRGSGPGRPAMRPMRTFRIARRAKEQLRWQLDVLFDLSERTLYPDLAGFEKHASRKWPTDAS